MPPVNDNFANATVIAGDTGSVGVDLVSATYEGSEPANVLGADGAASVWFSWTPDADVRVRFSTETTPLPEFNSTLEVFTGPDIASLVPVTVDDDGAVQPGSIASASRVLFDAEAGTTYWIRVDCWDTFQRSDAVLSWAPFVGYAIDYEANLKGPWSIVSVGGDTEVFPGSGNTQMETADYPTSYGRFDVYVEAEAVAWSVAGSITGGPGSTTPSTSDPDALFVSGLNVAALTMHALLICQTMTPGSRTMPMHATFLTWDETTELATVDLVPPFAFDATTETVEFTVAVTDQAARNAIRDAYNGDGLKVRLWSEGTEDAFNTDLLGSPVDHFAYDFDRVWFTFGFMPAAPAAPPLFATGDRVLVGVLAGQPDRLVILGKLHGA